MRFIPVLITLLALAVAPLASSAPAPEIAYLRDDSSGPVGDGILNGTAPEAADPSVRLVAAGSADLPSVVYVSDHTSQDRLKGPVFVAVWPGPTAVASGNLTAALYIEDADGARELLSTDSISLDADPSGMDPTALVPPDPTDPEAAAAYVMAQAVAEAAQPALVLDLGSVDVELAEGSTLAIGFYLEGNSEVPVPLGSATLQYDGTLAPSFAYVPWYAPDPPAPSTSSQTSSSSSPSATGSMSSSSSSSSSSAASSSTAPQDGGDAQPEKKSPGIGLLAAVALVGAAAYLVRRRLD